MSLLDGIVGCWSPALGATGYTLLDRGPYRKHGTLTNMDAGTDWVGSQVNGRAVTALDFDGSNDRVVLPFTSSHSPQFFTYCLWYYSRSLPQSPYYSLCLASNQENAGPYRGFDFRGASASTLECAIAIKTGGVETSQLVSLGNINTNTWTFISCTYDGTKLIGYRDTFIIETKNISGTAEPTTVQIWMGDNPSFNPRPYNGLLSDFGIYDRALSQSEISQLYQLGPGYLGRQLTGQFNRRRVFFVPSAFSSKPPLIVNQAIKTSYLW